MIIKKVIFFSKKGLTHKATFDIIIKSVATVTANARVAQLVEHDLAKVGVAGSSPVSRS